MDLDTCPSSPCTPYATTLPPPPHRTHQAARHRKCRRARLTPEHSAIAGTFWTETIFATCHTLSLFTFPASRDALGRVRGEGRVAPAACAHSRSHSPALLQPSRGGRVCARGQGRRDLRARPLPRRSRPVRARALRSAPHLVEPASAARR